MTKKIKFNLFLDGFPARSLEDITTHFNIDDLYDHYQSGLLLRWMEARDYTEELKAVEGINHEEDAKVIIEKLTTIFFKNADQSFIKSAALSLVHKKEQEERLQELKKEGAKENDVICKYFQGYEGVLADIIASREDFNLVKGHVRKMLSYYEAAFKLDYMRFWDIMIYAAPLAIFAVLMNMKYRSCYLSYEASHDDSYNADNMSQVNNEIVLPHFTVRQLVAKITAKDGCGAVELPFGDKVPPPRHAFLDDLKTLFEYSGMKYCKVGGTQMPLTGDHYFAKSVKFLNMMDGSDIYEQIEISENKKFMILYISDKCKVKGYRSTVSLECKEVNGKYPILTGLEYRCAMRTSALIYMEVT